MPGRNERPDYMRVGTAADAPGLFGKVVRQLHPNRLFYTAWHGYKMQELGRGVVVITVDGDITGKPGKTSVTYFAGKTGKPDCDKDIDAYDPLTEIVVAVIPANVIEPPTDGNTSRLLVRDAGMKGVETALLCVPPGKTVPQLYEEALLHAHQSGGAYNPVGYHPIGDTSKLKGLTKPGDSVSLTNAEVEQLLGVKLNPNSQGHA